MESTQIIQRQDSDLYYSPIITMEEAVSKFRTVREYTSKILSKGIDYGQSAGGKPSLLKPGAEKVASLFGFTAHFECIDKILNFNGEGNPDHEPFFYFEYRCTLTKGDQFVGECEGSCNSWEKKYRYRKAELNCPKCGKATIKRSKFGDGYYCYGKIGGCGAKFAGNDPAIVNQPKDDVKNYDTAEQVNTYQKMAQKRAFVGAVIVACNLSEYFTQDIEDIADFAVDDPIPDSTQRDNLSPAPEPEIIDGSYSEIPPVQQEEFDEDKFLASFNPPDDIPYVTPAKANQEIDSNGKIYKDIPTEQLRFRLNTLIKFLSRKDLTEEKRKEARNKLGIICSVLSDRKAKKAIKPVE